MKRSVSLDRGNKSKRSKTGGKTNAKPPAAGITDSVAPVVCGNTPVMSVAPACPVSDCNGQLLQCLLEKIDTEQKVIDNLLHKMNSVLKFLGIQEEVMMS